VDFSGAQSVLVNGTELAYIEQGSGDPVVFVHGAISDMRTWRHQLPSIGEHYRAISFSRRYARPNEDLAAGESDPWQVHVDDLAAFLKAVGAVPAHLVGNSQGAFLCMVLARDHPELVNSLILEEPAAFALMGSMPPRPIDIVKLMLRRPELAVAAAKFEQGVLRPVRAAFRSGEDEAGVVVFGQGVIGDEAYDRLPVERRHQMVENLSGLRAFILHPDVPAYSREDAEGVTQPVRLLEGDLSPKILKALVGWLAELIPGAEKVTIENSSHLMHEENYSATNTAILDFVNRNSQESG